MRFIDLLEQAYGRKAVRQLEPMQPGDVRSTYAATDRLRDWVGFAPATPLEEGLRRFAQWYRGYYGG
jgi:UDP-glucuronate 4-epimerase